MNVVELRPLQSKYDVEFRGKTFKLLLDPCECGVHARWVVEKRFIDTLPPFFRQMWVGKEDSDEAKQIIQETVLDWHWKPKWWHRVLGIKMESALKAWIEKSRNDILRIISNQMAVEKLRAEMSRPVRKPGEDQGL